MLSFLGVQSACGGSLSLRPTAGECGIRSQGELTKGESVGFHLATWKGRV